MCQFSVAICHQLSRFQNKCTHSIFGIFNGPAKRKVGDTFSKQYLHFVRLIKILLLHIQYEKWIENVLNTILYFSVKSLCIKLIVNPNSHFCFGYISTFSKRIIILFFPQMELCAYGFFSIWIILQRIIKLYLLLLDRCCRWQEYHTTANGHTIFIFDAPVYLLST